MLTCAFALLARAIEYTDCIPAEMGKTPSQRVS